MKLIRLFTWLTALVAATASGSPDKTLFAPLSSTLRENMARQRAFVAELAKSKQLKHRVTRSDADLDLIQEILDRRLLRKDQTWELQALGVIFGDVLSVKEPALQWRQITDEWGTDPTLRYKETSWRVNALTMISKRVEAGQEFDVRAFAEGVLETLRREASKG